MIAENFETLETHRIFFHEISEHPSKTYYFRKNTESGNLLKNYY